MKLPNDKKTLFAERLRALRAKRRLTQADLGALCGLKQGAISLYESGKDMPEVSSLLKLATGLRVPLETLVKGQDVRFDAVYQGLRLSIQTDDSDPPETGADLADEPPPFDVIIPGAPPAQRDSHEPVPTLAETHKKLQGLISGLISVSASLAAGPPPVARDMGPTIRERNARTREGKGRSRPQTPRTQDKRR